MLVNFTKYIQIITKGINLINLISALFLVVQGIFPNSKVFNITLYVFFISYGCEFFLEQRWKTFVWDKTRWVFVLFLLFYALLLLYYPFESNHEHISTLLTYRLPFFAFGVIGLLGINKYYRLKYFAYVFMLITLCVIFYLIFFRIGISEFFENPDRASVFKEMRVKYVNTHMVFNYYTNISLILAYFLINNYTGKYSLLIKIPLLVYMGFLFYILFLSEGRIGFITANLLVFIMIFISLWQWKKISAVAFSLIGVLVFLFIVYQHPRMFKNEDQLDKEFRLLLWEQAIELIEKEPILGYGPSTSAELFMQKCSINQEIIGAYDFPFMRGLELRKILCAHPHNQFLQTTLEFGLLGFLVLLLLNIVPIIVATRKRRIYVFLIILISVIQLMTDLYARGVPLIAFFMLITVFFCAKDDNSSKQVKVNEQG